MRLCTIAARNYLAHVRVLAASVGRHHPEATLTVLLVDSYPGDPLVPDEPFDILYPEDVMSAREFARMRIIYDVLELSTALKPSLLKALLTRAGEPVVYVDPDCTIYASLEGAAAAAETHSIVLTPHTNTPLPLDGLLIDERTIMRAGIFNLGFLAVAHGAGAFLDWWEQRVRTFACADPDDGMFTDQRWVDFVPAFWPHVVLRDPGYNVAYWNLHERTLARRADGGIAVNGEPLRFFHFSGFDPKRPEVLSRHQQERPRVLLSEHSLVAELCLAYAEALHHRGYDEVVSIPYRFGAVGGGALESWLRRLVRAELLDGDAADVPDPFGTDGGAAFLDWLAKPVGERGGVTLTRLLVGMWHSQPDLARAFPDLEGDDAFKLAAWADESPQFAPRFGHLRRVLPRAPGDPAPGVNVAGYLTAEVGVGESARLLVRAAEDAGVPVATFTYGATASRQADPFVASGPTGLCHDVTILCVNADETPRFVDTVERAATADKYRIGFWYWEVEEFPARFHGAFDHVDEVWVASEFTRAAIARHSDKPVSVFPLPITPGPLSFLEPGDLGLDGRFLFVCCWDAFSVPARKNPTAAIDAYVNAFGPGGDTRLLVKSVNGDRCPEEIEELRSLTRGRDDVTIVDSYWPRHWMTAIMQLAGCYVSLHRAEGFGLNLATAAAQGKPVIATGYSGNLDFMLGDLLVPFALVPVGPGRDPYPAEARWAEPDVDAAAALMRRVRNEPAWADAVGRRGASHVGHTHGTDVSTASLRGHLERLGVADFAR